MIVCGVVIDDIAIQKMIKMLDDEDGFQGIWKTLIFMEVHNYDWALMKRRIHSYVFETSYSPFFGLRMLNHEEEREIILKLRQHTRQLIGLVQLTEFETTSWNYEEPKLLKYRNTSTEKYSNDMPNMDPDDISEVRSRFVQRRPDVLRYVKLAVAHNEKVAPDYVYPYDGIFVRYDWSYGDSALNRCLI